MDRTQKEEQVSSLRTMLEESSVVVVTHYSGMTVMEMTDLRGKMRQAGAGFKVTKNRLTRLALEGTKFEALGDLFKGPTAIAFSKDPVAPAKVVVDFAKSNAKLVVLGGGIGAQVLDAAGIGALAALPSLDQTRAKIIGLISAPATKIAGVLQAPAGQLARVMNAYATKGEAA